MQTFFNHPEIMQVYQFIKYLKLSCLNLQFVFLKTSKKIKNIQKTVIFVNSIYNKVNLITKLNLECSV